MNVLVACEESQEVCKAFRARGHRAFSCDLQECSGGHPEWHIQGDALPLLNGNCTFQTADKYTHTQSGRWDLIIAHPPCQKLSCAGAVNLGRKDSVCKTREWREKFFLDRTDAAIFFMAFLAANCEKIAVENPVGFMCTHYRKPDQYIEPWMFGDPWKKKTGLWLKGLPKLNPTNIVKPTGKWVQQNRKNMAPRGEAWKVVGHRDAKTRAKTFSGVARAMSEQWG